MPELSEHPFRRILIIKPSSFGDVIHALPVLNGLRQAYPNARISWLVSTACAALLEAHPALDEIILFDRKRYGRIGRDLKITLEFARFVLDLRARNFNLVVDLQGLFRSGFFALAGGAPVRMGFAAAREFGAMFYSHRITCKDPDMHAVDRNYLFGRRLGFENVPITFELPIQPQARESVQHKLQKAGIIPGQPYVLMAPGTRWETKLWPAEYFAEIANWILDRHRLPVVLIGTGDEVDIARKVHEHADGRTVNLAGTTSLPEVIALVAETVLAVMHDSGPMHLATAFNKPMVAIFGPTSPRRTGPYRHPEAVARLDLPCSPCYLKKVADCPYNHRCMKDLSPNLIREKISGILTGGETGP